MTQNVLLHAGSAVIVYFIALRILAHRGGALVTALVFSLHPLRIESVVWISERKDVLSCFFVVLAVLLYLRAVERRRFPWLALGAFVLGFMSKPIAVVLPVYLVAQHQEMAPLTVREVNELSLQRSPAIAGDVDLAAAGVVQAARQVEQRQLGRLAILGAAEAEEGGH